MQGNLHVYLAHDILSEQLTEESAAPLRKQALGLWLAQLVVQLPLPLGNLAERLAPVHEQLAKRVGIISPSTV